MSIEKDLKRIARQFPTVAGNIIVNQANQNFQSQSDSDGSPWKRRKPIKRKRKRKSDNRAILVKTGRLKRSIRAVKVGKLSVKISAAYYGKHHNEGFKGVIAVSSHTRRQGKKAVRVKSHSKKINIPKREFINIESKAVIKKINRAWERRIEKTLSKHGFEKERK